VGIDGTVPSSGQNLQAGFDTPGYAWCGWRDGGTSSRATLDVPDAGYHTISIFMREDGFFADKLVLTTDAGYTPTGLGPDETGREQASVPMIEIIPGSLQATSGSVSMRVQTVQGLTNIVEYKNSLADANWTTVSSFNGSGAIVTVTDSGSLPNGRFYRARVVIP
jgi:hypothetical protein